MFINQIFCHSNKKNVCYFFEREHVSVPTIIVSKIKKCQSFEILHSPSFTPFQTNQRRFFNPERSVINFHDVFFFFFFWNFFQKFNRTSWTINTCLKMKRKQKWKNVVFSKKKKNTIFEARWIQSFHILKLL